MKSAATVLYASVRIFEITGWKVLRRGKERRHGFCRAVACAFFFSLKFFGECFLENNLFMP